MKSLKRLFQGLGIVVAIWVLGSFVGVMFDPARANLWTQSLMWAMLSSVILAPVFIFISTDSSRQTRKSRQASQKQQKEQSFEVDENVDVNQREGNAKKQEGWPYTEE